MTPEIREQAFLTTLPDNFLTPIGRVICMWAWSEALLDQVIWKLLGHTHRKGRAVTNLLGFNAKIDLILTLFSLSRRDKSKLNHLKKEGKILAKERNLVAHGYSAVADRSNDLAIFISFSARGKLAERHRTAFPETIQALAVRIAKFNVFLKEIHDLLPLPNKRTPSKNTNSKNPRRSRSTAIRQPPLLGTSDRELNEAEQRRGAKSKHAAKAKKKK